MANNIVQLTDYDNNNIYPIAGAAAQGSITKAMLDEGVFVGAELSDPGNIAYVGTSDIQDNAVTAPKLGIPCPVISENLSEPSSVAYVATDNIQDGAVTSDKIDSATLDVSTITPTSGYDISSASIYKRGGIVYFGGSMVTPAITSTDNQTVAFTLPVGWRPKANSNFLTFSFPYDGTTSPIIRIRVASDGTVKISKITDNIAGGNWAQLGNISYIAQE